MDEDNNRISVSDMKQKLLFAKYGLLNGVEYYNRQWKSNVKVKFYSLEHDRNYYGGTGYTLVHESNLDIYEEKIPAIDKRLKIDEI